MLRDTDLKMIKIMILKENYSQSTITQCTPKDLRLRSILSVKSLWNLLFTIMGSDNNVNIFAKLSPIRAVRKLSGKLRLLVDLRRINHFLCHDYDNHNFPKVTLADISSYLAAKKLSLSLNVVKRIMYCKWRILYRFNCNHLLFCHVRSRTYALHNV